jgi:hypothetical protein
MEQQLREPTIVVRGDVPDQIVAYGRRKLLTVVAHAAVPVLDAELRLDHHTDPARERPEHYRVRRDDGHEGLFYPGAGAHSLHPGKGRDAS